MSLRDTIKYMAADLAVARQSFQHSDKRSRIERDELLIATAYGVQNCLRSLAMLFPASCDTHPKDGDVQQAPLVSGAVPEGQTPEHGSSPSIEVPE